MGKLTIRRFIQCTNHVWSSQHPRAFTPNPVFCIVPVHIRLLESSHPTLSSIVACASGRRTRPVRAYEDQQLERKSGIEEAFPPCQPMRSNTALELQSAATIPKSSLPSRPQKHRILRLIARLAVGSCRLPGESRTEQIARQCPPQIGKTISKPHLAQLHLQRTNATRHRVRAKVCQL